MGSPLLGRVQTDKGEAINLSGQMDISPPYYGKDIYNAGCSTFGPRYPIDLEALKKAATVPTSDVEAQVTATLGNGEQSKLETYEEIEYDDDAIQLPNNVPAFSGKFAEGTLDPTIDLEPGLSPEEWIQSQGFATLPTTSLGCDGSDPNIFAELQILNKRLHNLEMAVGIADQVKQKNNSLFKRIGCVEAVLGMMGKEDLMRDDVRRTPYKGITKEQMMESIMEALKFGNAQYGLAKEFLSKLVSDSLGIKIHESAYYTKKFNAVVRFGIASKKFVKHADNLYRLA